MRTEVHPGSRNRGTISRMLSTTRALPLAACLVVAACQPPAGATRGPTDPGNPTRSEGVMPTSEATTTGPFALTSSAFVEGGAIPRTYACDGQDTSPPLAWAGAPEGTATLALVMTDPDAGGFVHWVFFNVDASGSGGIPAGFSASPDGPPQGRNSFGRIGYGGPCPPSGTHRYVFRLLALASALPLTGTPSANQVLAEADGHVLAEAKLTGTYRKGG